MGTCCNKKKPIEIKKETGVIATNAEDKLLESTVLCSQQNETESESCISVNFSVKSEEKNITLDDFDRLKIIGKGAFGKVLLVRFRESGEIFAMKILKKQFIIKKRQVDHTKTERVMLEKLNHPFIVKLIYAFQDKEKLYFVTEFLQGGELFFHLRRNEGYSEKEVRFYMSQILLALEYMHSQNYIYRDLKPENILIAKDGNIKLTDFGLSKLLDKENKTFTLCGTQEYLAPEIFIGKGYEKVCDWFSFGVVIFELFCCFHPFKKKKNKKIDMSLYTTKMVMPKKVPIVAQDLIYKLFEFDPHKRLGFNGADEVKKHPFFNGVDFNLVYNKKYEPPFIPKLRSDIDLRYFDITFTEERVDSVRMKDEMNSKENNLENSQNINEEKNGDVDFEGFSYKPETEKENPDEDNKKEKQGENDNN